MLLTYLAALVAAATIQIHHCQVPVIQDKDLRRKALRSWEVRDGVLYVNLDASRVKDIRKPFALKIKAKGFAVKEDGSRKHRLARKVRTAGDDGVAAYRIPGLVTTKKGTLVGVYDIRYENSRDLQGHVDVGVSRSTDGGRTWGPMIVAMDMGEWGGPDCRRM